MVSRILTEKRFDNIWYIISCPSHSTVNGVWLTRKSQQFMLRMGFCCKVVDKMVTGLTHKIAYLPSQLNVVKNLLAKDIYRVILLNLILSLIVQLFANGPPPGSCKKKKKSPSCERGVGILKNDTVRVKKVAIWCPSCHCLSRDVEHVERCTETVKVKIRRLSEKAGRRRWNFA